MTSVTLRITCEMPVSPAYLVEYVRAHLERGPEPVDIPDDVYDMLEAAEIGVETVEATA